MTIHYFGTDYEVALIDDGTLDTVICINGKQHRLNQDYASLYRESDGSMTEQGLHAIAVDVIESEDES